MKWIALSIFFLSLLSCDTIFNSRVPVFDAPRPTSPGTIPRITPSSRQPKWGLVGCSPSQSASFQRNIKQFLSSSIDISSVGAVACLDKDIQMGIRGFFFKGQVTFKGNKVFNPRAQFEQSLHASDKSYIELHIKASSASSLTPVRLNLSPSGGTVSNDILSLSFEDEKGLITLDGRVTEEKVFSGDFSYENFTTYDGNSGGYSGKIGFFKIDACSFLKCL